MRKIIQAESLDTYEDQYEIEIQLPNSCPRCGVAYAELPLNAYCVDTDDFYKSETNLFSLYYCPHCEKCFMIHYHVIFSGILKGSVYRTYPVPESTQEFSKNIQLLSPKFIEIYRQSATAENNGLLEICGMGYRKALEFLVKDYAIKFNPESKKGICNSLLSSCIDSYIDNRRIKALSKASAWLGNDETHYVRKHEDYSLEHLKAFIASIVLYIDSELTYLEAEKLLTTVKK